MFDHWRGLCGGGETGHWVPLREQVDLLTLPKSTWESFFLIERRENRYLVRLASTRLIDNMGSETTGKYLDELMRPEIYPARRALFDRCTDEALPVYYGATLAAAAREHVAFRRILLPLRSADGGAVDLVCGVMEFVSTSDLQDAAATGESEGPAEAADNNGLVFQLIFKNDRWRHWSA